MAQEPGSSRGIDSGRSAAEDLEQLRAIARALFDPRRLIDIVSSVDDEAQAVDALRVEFDLTEQAARAVMDQQIRIMTRGSVARLRQLIIDMEQGAPTGSVPGAPPNATDLGTH